MSTDKKVTSEWGSKARKAEARTKRAATRRAAITEARTA